MPKAPWDLSGKVILVTGGNAGIGLGFCRGIARAGGDVVIWGRRGEKNREAAAALAEFGTRVITQEVDVSNEAGVIAAMSEAVRKLGRVDGVIANAGVMNHVGSFLQMTAEAYHGLLAINQHGAFYVAREAARHMKARHDAGKIDGGWMANAGKANLSAGRGT